PMDDMGHGSHCAGTVAGDGTAGTQTGMAPDATIMAIKVLNSDCGGNGNAIFSGVEFAVEHGAHVFSMSLGFYGGGTQSERITFRNTMINALEAGVVGSVAAGNEGSDYAVPVPNNVRVPGNCPPPWLHPDQTITGGLTCVICVGSTDQNDQISYFSSKGPVTWQSISGFNDYAYNPGIGLIRPDICAPGSGIKSLNYQNNTGYVMMDGTSMATPCAAGVMGLMLSKNIDLSPAQIDEILETTAIPLSTTKSNTFGSGRIDALAAVEEVIVGPVVFYAYEVNDVEGNQDGKLNPGETVNLTVSMQNIFDTPINNVGVNLTSDNPYVTITSATAIYGNFSPNEIKTIENAFTFTLSEDAPIKQNIVLNVEASSSTDNCVTRCKIMTYGYDLSSGKIVVDDGEGNNNGVLEPGETADLQFYINNIGNDFASSLIGTLSSISNDITINTNDLSFGSLMGDQSGFAAYNVTVSENIAPEDINFPFTLSVSDRYEKETILSYVYQNNCKVVFELHDQYGDGWNGASIRVSFNDGTPLQNLTIADGNFESYILEINSGTIVTLHWTSGSWDEECSFSVYYENGDMIYDGSTAPSSGDFYTWTNNCSGGGETSSCHHVDNLSAESSSYNALLSWDASATAISYKVYRDHEMIAQNITTNVYADENLTIGDYCYTITAICSDNVETNPSNEACVTISDSCYTPQNLTAIVDGLNIDLQWDDAENAQSYTVYRDDVVIVSNVMLSQYTDENLPIGNYCYQVAANCNSGESDLSDIACGDIISIAEHDARFTIYPNPADLKLIIEGENIKTIAIVNVLGQTLENISCINKSKHEINTAAYKNGVYIVSITTTNGSVITKRFIVTH
ncbi:MAG: S8 family serine peptidase, partial [Bacteroidales bacterium]|nr:S8 family serine peptidase [Bacteroidales bacterium]